MCVTTIVDDSELMQHNKRSHTCEVNSEQQALAY